MFYLLLAADAAAAADNGLAARFGDGLAAFFALISGNGGGVVFFGLFADGGFAVKLLDFGGAVVEVVLSDGLLV